MNIYLFTTFIFSSALQGRTLESPLSVSDLYSSTLQCLQSNPSMPSKQPFKAFNAPVSQWPLLINPSMPSKQPFKAFNAPVSQWPLLINPSMPSKPSMPLSVSDLYSSTFNAFKATCQSLQSSSKPVKISLSYWTHLRWKRRQSFSKAANPGIFAQSKLVCLITSQEEKEAKFEQSY